MHEAQLSEQLADRAARALDEGQLIVLPTETVYGVAASVASDAGMAALQRFRGSTGDQAFTLHLSDPGEAGSYVPLGGGVGSVVDRLLPGPVTLRVAVSEAEVDERLPGIGLTAAQRPRVYDGSVVGLRCPDHPVARQVLARASGPVVAVAVRGPDGRLAVEAGEAGDAVGGSAALVLDGGRCRFGSPSTIVRVMPGRQAARVAVEREGGYDERTIRRMLSWTLLLVCSGNTCRSPMAAALARQLLAQQRGLDESELVTAGIHVMSAGLYATAGAGASEPAIEAMRDEGLDLSGHQSQPLTTELIERADLILTMTEAHRVGVVSLAPWAEQKVARLDPEGDVGDPIGSDKGVYRRTAAQIRERLAERLKERR